ncbi:hypothetical protein C5167_041614 [Papaver somniferum]|nr:hypothetical protein C5167_041614 [Papaver somniferum]
MTDEVIGKGNNEAVEITASCQRHIRYERNQKIYEQGEMELLEGYHRERELRRLLDETRGENREPRYEEERKPEEESRRVKTEADIDEIRRRTIDHEILCELRSLKMQLQYNNGYEADYNLIHSILEFLSSSIKDIPLCSDGRQGSLFFTRRSPRIIEQEAAMSCYKCSLLIVFYLALESATKKRPPVVVRQNY